MKNKKICYIGYVIGFISLVALFIFKDDETLSRILPFIFTTSVTISSVSLGHNRRMEEDPFYRINVNDERNEKIRDKVNATMTPILMLIMGLAAVICFSAKAYLPAIILALGIISFPIITFFVSSYYEKKY